MVQIRKKINQKYQQQQTQRDKHTIVSTHTLKADMRITTKKSHPSYDLSFLNQILFSDHIE